MNDILWPIAWFFALGIGFGLLLAAAGKWFAAEPDPRIELVNEALPAANCGGCGYAGCLALAEAIVKGEAKGSDCLAGGI
ncbi:MAG: ferredoxin, partial [Oscillospiraceae bacterium]|nr:ferredoxin [Oscillospiraceae bacterium]